MTTTGLTSRGERLAQRAEDLDAFSGLKLLHVRRVVTDALSIIGRGGFFHEYTKHDISHIQALLALQEVLIPEATWHHISPADALLQVLAIYLHDLGMLITEDEFANRARTSFETFKQQRSRDEDYSAKVLDLGEDKAERFLYQEYVRTHHGTRVRHWITGSGGELLGATDAVASELATLLKPLPASFRDDLGLVCESHHLDDLDRIDKYLVTKPYGRSKDEHANVQYAAIVLRSVDLLHITSDRTPSVAFNLIAPKDPVSQQEWAKHRAVDAVVPKPAVDREGNVDHSLPMDTLQIFAQFTDDNAFFGLSAYLQYAERQLQQSHTWAAASQKRHGSPLAFPWRYIDDSQIKTQGFLKQTFHFVLDQARVLDLLTGHTLYNNTNIVLRELTQNSLDAVRFQHGNASEHAGLVQVTWDSAQRLLRVWDNGTGMTQEVIERHLLTVGSSRYQEPEFKRRHPDFSPISRFGIGILSTFMIADEVIIVTCHPEEEFARRLMLRSVHGRYLVSTLDKKRDDVAATIGDHGTLVELKVRPSAPILDVIETLQHWIVVPGCRVEAVVDGDAPKIVGFGSVAEALEDWMRQRGLPIGEDDGRYKVQSTTGDGVTIAMGLAWSERYQEWTFVEAGRRREYDTAPLGLCVEGIRVERGSPGFHGHVVAAIADARGARAPRTDVARSELEVTEELTVALREIYETYAAHVRREVDALMGARGYSLDWTAEEARMLLAPLIRRKAVEEDLLTEVLSEVPTIVLDDGTRRLASVKELGTIARFWTIHSALFDSMRSLFREVSTTASAAGIIRALGVTGVKFPGEPVIDASWTDVSQREAFRGRDVALVVLQSDQRRVDFAWEWYESAPRWWSFRPDVRGYPELVEVLERGRFRALGMPQVLDNCMVAGSAVAISGRSKEAGVRIAQSVYLFPGTAVAGYLERLRARFDAEDTRDARAVQVVVFQALGRLLTSVRRVTASDVAELIERTMFVDSELRLRDIVPRFMDVNEFVHAVTAEPILIFDPHGWRRVDEDGDEYDYEYEYEYDYEPW